MPETIYILIIEHQHGVDVSAHRIPESAYAALASYCRDFWNEAYDENPKLGDEPPADDKMAVELYFKTLADTADAEHWEIRTVELEDKPAET